MTNRQDREGGTTAGQDEAAAGHDVDTAASGKSKVSGTFYVLLCRHGPHRDGELLAEGDPPTVPSELVGSRLREQLQFASPHGTEPIHLRCLLYGSAPEVTATARVLADSLGTLARASDPEFIELTTKTTDKGKSQTVLCLEYEKLDQAQFQQVGDDKRLADMLRSIASGEQPPEGSGLPTKLTDDNAALLPDGNAVLVVGHQPHLGWLSEALLRRWRLPFVNFSVPFGRAELVCLAFPRFTQLGKLSPTRGRVLWTIAPQDSKVADDVRAKIKSKMDIAKTLGAVITFGLGALLGVLLDPNRWKLLTAPMQSLVSLAAALLFVSLILYLASMYSFDRLLMPERFWRERRPPGRAQLSRGWLVQRPPSSAASVLYRNMMRVWRWQFTLATGSLLAALAVLAAAALRLEAAWQWSVFAAIAGLVAVTAYVFRPILGSED